VNWSSPIPVGRPANNASAAEFITAEKKPGTGEAEAGAADMSEGHLQGQRA
jgi:hypothetical protein